MEYKAEDIHHSTNVSHHVHILVRWHGSITQTRLIFPHLHRSQSPQRGSALPIVANKLKQLSGVSVFSKLDANIGFGKIPLDKESHPLATVITPYSHFCFNKTPSLRINSSPEHFRSE